MEINNVSQTTNSLITNYDSSELLLGGNRTIQETYENATGASLTLAAGTVIDRVTATGKIIAFNSATGANNKKPIGVLVEGLTIGIGGSAAVTICIDGEVNENKVVLVNAADTLDTVVSGSKIRDLIMQFSAGVKVTPVAELGEYDNQ